MTMRGTIQPTTMKRSMRALSLLAIAALATSAGAQGQPRSADTTLTLITPARVFDGTEMHEGWSVLVRGDRITGAGPAGSLNAPTSAKRIELPGTTLMPGLIEMHSHLLLHPYN